jgi:hypothetical protein
MEKLLQALEPVKLNQDLGGSNQWAKPCIWMRSMLRTGIEWNNEELLHIAYWVASA